MGARRRSDRHSREPVHLDGVLAAWADDAEDRRAVVSVILALAAASVEIGRQLAVAPLVGGSTTKWEATLARLQSRMDEQAHRILLDALQSTRLPSSLRRSTTCPSGSTRALHWSWPSTPSTARATWPSTGPWDSSSRSGQHRRAGRVRLLRPGSEQIAAGFVLYARRPC